MKKTLLLLAIAVLSMATLASADTFTTYANRAQQPASDLIDWGQLGAPGTIVPTPFSGTTFNGNPYMAGNINFSAFVAVQEGAGWNGGFDFGESLMWTGNPNVGTPAGPGPFGIVLSTPVSNFGFGIEADLIAPFTATISAYNTMGSLLYTNTFNQPLPSCGFANSCVLFIGVGDLSGANIGMILISTDSGNPNFANDFAIDGVTLGYGNATPLPEPGSLVLMGTGLLGLAGLLRRKLSK